MYVVWSSQLGAGERHVPEAAALLRDPRARHFWDPGQLAGTAFQEPLGLSVPAWDLWLLFDREATWRDAVPALAWWEHQLMGEGLPGERVLDPERFAARAGELLHRIPPPPEVGGGSDSGSRRGTQPLGE